MGLFNLFKSKEEREKERIEREKEARIRKEKEEKNKDAAWIEAEKIINYFESESKKNLEENKQIYSFEFFSVYHDISYIKDIEVKIYTVLYVANHFFIGSFHEYKNVEYFFRGEPEKSELYHVYSISVDVSNGEWLPSILDGEDYCKSKYFKNSYDIKSLKFEDVYKGLSIIVFKNKIYYDYSEDSIKIRESSEKWSNSYDRGGLLMNR